MDLIIREMSSLVAVWSWTLASAAEAVSRCSASMLDGMLTGWYPVIRIDWDALLDLDIVDAF